LSRRCFLQNGGGWSWSTNSKSMLDQKVKSQGKIMLETDL